jgi:Replication initiator protein A (RepA) N-terminus.
MQKRYTVNDVINNQFYQLPKFLFHDKFKKLSNNAKVLYALLKDRHQLSIENNWINERGEVYLIFTREEMSEMLQCTRKTAQKAFEELKDAELVQEERSGLGKANLIYLTFPDFVSHESLENSLMCKNYTSGSVIFTHQEVQFLHTNNTNINNTDINNTELINHSINNNTITVENRENFGNKKIDGLIDELSQKYNLTKDEIKMLLERMQNKKIKNARKYLEMMIKQYIANEKEIFTEVKNNKYTVPKNYFNAYSQRTYDVDELEKNCSKQVLKRIKTISQNAECCERNNNYFKIKKRRNSSC